MQQSNGGAQFSSSELKDLFRLDEERACQTHELIGCQCGGRGITDSSVPVSGTATPADGSDEELSDAPSVEDLDSDDSLLEPLRLTRASDVDMEKQEREIRDGTLRSKMAGKKNKGKHEKSKDSKDKMHQTLAQYAHIDPTLLNPDVEDEELEAAVDDDVLVSMLKDECNLIGYVFKKTNGAEMGT
ncbi:unnamed protein product [Penicillium salamii]|uniref:Uncharacterized protein n=1 Tax=Penicillium salamii TaxID=1612424 RepID=A0A9W4NM15_9EURO|nr:unnamed protein product [Penicillium salamii]CAG8238349.1 unnamed protein product [Penicillium salamii]CAG8321217.1 unnamed protein product [Penicillium salamii]CAG8363532.1 unnamed protein product [Penicillium salamii]CAG8388352.1 unnamed protein product [Penicillium salamii]